MKTPAILTLILSLNAVSAAAAAKPIVLPSGLRCSAVTTGKEALSFQDGAFRVELPAPNGGSEMFTTRAGEPIVGHLAADSMTHFTLSTFAWRGWEKCAEYTLDPTAGLLDHCGPWLRTFESHTLRIDLTHPETASIRKAYTSVATPFPQMPALLGKHERSSSVVELRCEVR